jgi:TPP-dependent pyruvate/acetoin dehydrogenase alpha subunit
MAENILKDILLKMYETMVKIRRFEESLIEPLNRKEIACPVHLYIGQEGVATGVCANLRKEDWVFSTHRSHGHYIAKGGDIKALMAELYGKVTGCSKGRGGSMHLSSPDIGLPGSSAIVAGTIPPAVGAALAFSMQKKDTISVAFFGDGAVGEGAFYESLNFSALKKLPVVFVCENNLYSTHMPIDRCLADVNIYKKAAMFNMPGIRIDGNNVIEVCNAAKKAVEKARHGEGPTLIECMTYRWLGHVGPSNDLDKGLRSRVEWESWVKKCPVKMFEAFLFKHSILSEPKQTRIIESIKKEIRDAFSFAKESPCPNPDEDETSSVFKTRGES